MSELAELLWYENLLSAVIPQQDFQRKLGGPRIFISDASGNPTPYFELLFRCFPNSPFGDSDFLLMEEADVSSLEDDQTSYNVDQKYQVLGGDIMLLEAIFKHIEPPPPPKSRTILPGVGKNYKLCEDKTVKHFPLDETRGFDSRNCQPHLE
ncbi:hypothetical protein Tco_1220304 [Tanacetum coccineum]